MPESFLAEAKLAHRRGDLKCALELSEKGLAQGSELSSAKRHELWVLKSHCLSALGKWLESVRALESATQEGTISAEAEARLMMHRGYLMGSLARYSECFALLHRAELAARELGNSKLVAETLWRRGLISIFVGDYAMAEKCLRSSAEIALAEKDRSLEALSIAGIAKNLMYQERYNDAIAKFEEALKIFEETDSAFYIAVAHSELGNCYMFLGETGKALQLLESSAQVFLENGAMPNYQVNLAGIGNVFLRRGEYLKAVTYYQQALGMARELGDQLSTAKWLRNLCQAYSLLGNPALARGFEMEADSVNGSLAAERERAVHYAMSIK